MKKSEIALGILRIPLDFGMALLAFWLAYKLRLYSDLVPGFYFPVDLVSFPSAWQYLQLSIFSSLGLIGIFALNQMYSLRSTSRVGNEFMKIIFLSSAWIMLIIAYRYTDAYGSKFGKVMEAYKGQLDQLDRLGAKMALAGASTGEIAKANAELAKNTNYISMATFAIQNIKQKIDQVQNSAQSVLSNIHEQEKQVISNVRGG